MLLSVQDLRGGLRLLRSDPALTIVAALTLSLGIASTTTVFSWVDGVLLRPVPGVAHPEQLAVLEHVSPTGAFLGATHPDFRDFQRSMAQAAGVFASHFTTFMVGPPQESQRISGQIVSANYFAVLGVKPVIGRMFTPQEDRDDQGAFPLAVISHRFWKSAYREDPNVLGRTVRVNSRPLTIIGVAPPEFRGTVGGLRMDMWVPLSMIVQMGSLNTWAAADRNARFLEVWLRLKPGVDLQQAHAEAQSVAAHTAAAFPKTHAGVGATVRYVPEAHTGAQSLLHNPLRILTAICALVLLIACANVANLLLARSVSRQREFGIRMAMGATRAAMARMLLNEVMILAAAGSVAGVALSLWMSESLVALLPNTGLPIATDSLGGHLNPRILAFTVCVSIGSTILSALMPVLYAGRVPVNEILKEEGRSGTSSAHTHRARSLLVVVEVALTAIALIGAGLFLRSFHNTRQLHPGFDSDRVLVAQMFLSYAGYDRDREKLFNRNLRQRLEASPGVESAAYANAIPLWFGDPPSERIQIEGTPQQAVINIGSTVVSPGYFRLMRIPLVDGRDFTDLDDQKAPSVIIVNQTFARRFFGNENPIGRRIINNEKPRTVVGVVRDSKYGSPAESPQPYFYSPFQQRFGTGQHNAIYLRATVDPEEARAILRREVAALDPASNLYDAMPLTEYTQASLYPQKVAAILLAALAALSLLLAAMGLYSVMAYAVTERTREIGIRVALGAGRFDVLGMVIRKALLLTAYGLLCGFLAALASARVIGSLLVQMDAVDPVTYAAAAGFLGLIAFLASYIPARQAIQVDPVTALRR